MHDWSVVSSWSHGGGGSCGAFALELDREPVAFGLQAFQAGSGFDQGGTPPWARATPATSRRTPRSPITPVANPATNSQPGLIENVAPTASTLIDEVFARRRRQPARRQPGEGEARGSPRCTSIDQSRLCQGRLHGNMTVQATVETRRPVPPEGLYRTERFVPAHEIRTSQRRPWCASGGFMGCPQWCDRGALRVRLSVPERRPVALRPVLSAPPSPAGLAGIRPRYCRRVMVRDRDFIDDFGD